MFCWGSFLGENFDGAAVVGAEARVKIAFSLFCSFPRVKREGKHRLDPSMKSSEGSTDILRCYSQRVDLTTSLP